MTPLSASEVVVGYESGALKFWDSIHLRCVHTIASTSPSAVRSIFVYPLPISPQVVPPPPAHSPSSSSLSESLADSAPNDIFSSSSSGSFLKSVHASVHHDRDSFLILAGHQDCSIDCFVLRGRLVKTQ